MASLTKIGIAVLLVLLVSTVVLGQFSFPYPVYGKVTNNGRAVMSVEVLVKHLGNGQQLVGVTNKQGDYLVDASKLGAEDNDLLEVVGCKGDPALCVKRVKVASERVRVDFELSRAGVVTRKGGLTAVLAGVAALLGGAGVYFVRKWKGRKASKK